MCRLKLGLDRFEIFSTFITEVVPEAVQPTLGPSPIDSKGPLKIVDLPAHGISVRIGVARTRIMPPI